MEVTVSGLQEYKDAREEVFQECQKIKQPHPTRHEVITYMKCIFEDFFLHPGFQECKKEQIYLTITYCDSSNSTNIHFMGLSVAIDLNCHLFYHAGA